MALQRDLPEASAPASGGNSKKIACDLTTALVIALEKNEQYVLALAIKKVCERHSGRQDPDTPHRTRQPPCVEYNREVVRRKEVATARGPAGAWFLVLVHRTLEGTCPLQPVVSSIIYAKMLDLLLW